MKVTFLIGNGFDIGVGLKTRYIDFLNYYIKQPSENDIIQDFKSKLSKDTEIWSDFEKTLGKETANPPLDTVEGFSSCITDFKIQLARYLKDQEAKIDYDDKQKYISKQITQSLLNYCERGLENRYKTQLKNSISVYQPSDCIFEFLSFNYTHVLDRCLETAKQNGPINPRENSAEPGAQYVDSIGSVVHIHGTTEDRMIMGVNDESQISNSKLLQHSKFTRRAIKPAINSECGALVDSDAEKIINESDIICIFGMSLGITDRFWWQRVLYWLKANSAHQLIIIPYTEKQDPLLPESTLDIIEDIKDMFYESSGASIEEKNGTISRIFVPINPHIFELKLIKNNKNNFDMFSIMNDESIKAIQLLKNSDLQEIINNKELSIQLDEHNQLLKNSQKAQVR